MIVDASVALKWLIQEDSSGEALALLGRSDLAAPTLIHAEVANALWKKWRLGELADDPELAGLPDQIASLIETVDETPMTARALQIARLLDHPVYDCIYLSVAESLDRELVTADRRFLRKAAAHDFGSRLVLLDQV